MAVDIPGVSLSGTLTLQINDTAEVVNELFRIGEDRVLLSLPEGPFVRVAGQGIMIDVLGQTLTGDVAFQTNGSEVQLIIENVGLDLGDGLVKVTGAEGTLLITGDGITGGFTGSVALNVPGVSFSTDLTVAMDTTDPADRPDGIALAALCAQ